MYPKLNQPSASKDNSQKTPPLSEKERTELAAAGKCFKCKEPGHILQNCPLGTTVRSDRHDKPLRFSSFNLEMQLDTTERLRDLADTTETVGTMSLALLGLELDDGFADLPQLEDYDSSDSDKDYDSTNDQVPSS